MPDRQRRLDLVVVDPRTFDGNCFQVAERAALQAQAIIDIAIQSIADAEVMARNAYMERNLLAGNDPDAAGWEATTEAQHWKLRAEAARDLSKRLGYLAMSAGFDPKAKA